MMITIFYERFNTEWQWWVVSWAKQPYTKHPHHNTHNPQNSFRLITFSRVVRKSIARVLLVIGQQQKLQVAQYYSGKKLKPLDLRTKKTRAMRRALKPSERRAKSARVAKRAIAFPQRKYAVKA